MDSEATDLLVVITETETWLLSGNCVRARATHALNDQRVQQLTATDLLPEEYGALLFSSVFPETTNLSGWMLSQIESRPSLHIQLAIASTRLEPLRWESLTLPNFFQRRVATPLACSRASSLARQLPQEITLSGRVSSEELGLLFALPEPVIREEGRPLTTIDKGTFVDAMELALGGTKLRPDYFGLDRVSLRRLEERLLEGPQVDILHLVTHGSSLERQEPCVMLESDTTGETEWVTAGELGRAIGDAPVELVLLVTCDEGSQGQAGSVPFGKSLLRNSAVSAVVAMHCPISQGAAAEFTREFYKRLVRDRDGEGLTPEIRIGSPVNWGRSQLRSLDSYIDHGREPWAWSAPVLFWRAGGRFPKVRLRRLAYLGTHGDPRSDRWSAPPPQYAGVGSAGRATRRSGPVPLDLRDRPP
jgi:hypothetical protein